MAATTSPIEDFRAARLGLKRYFLFALTASLAANLFLGAALFIKPSPVLTIVVPPETDAENGWRFTEVGPDGRYLERWALSAVGLAFNLSPSTMHSSVGRLLELTDPAVNAELEKKLIRETEGLKQDRASSVFYPTRTKTDAEALTVDVEGVKKLLIGSTVTDSRTIVVRVEARYDAGTLFLKRLSELSSEEALKSFK